MTNRILPGLALWCLICVILAVLLVTEPRPVGARLEKPGAVKAVASVEDRAFAPLEQSTASSELWTTGFTFEGDEPTYNDIIGRIFDQGAFRSYRATDIYYIFPAPANRPTVETARFRIADKTGAYDGDVRLTLEILEHKTGALRQTVATAGDGWAETGRIWTALTLSSSDLQIAPDEFLAFHFQLSGDKGGDLDIRPEFEVEMQRPNAAGKDLSASEPVSTELWRSGFPVEGTFNYEFIEGRLAGVTAAFRSNRGFSDIYYVFPAPAKPTTIQSAKFYIIDRTGSYEGNANLILEIYNEAGVASRTVSATTIADLESVATESWRTIALSGTAGLEISNDEYLAARVEFDEGPAGNLDLRLLFEVEVTSSEAITTGQPQLHLPIILK